MKHVLTIVAIVVSATMLAPAMAHTEVYVATLNGASEFPANDSPGIGSATVSFDVDLYSMRVQASFSGLTGTTTNAHIHCCTTNSGLGGDAAASAAGNVGVATTLPTFPDFPAGVSAGNYDRTFNMLALASYNPAFVTTNGGAGSDQQRAAASFTALLNGVQAGKAYLNIHSSYRAGGEIRGFLAPVPEPQSYALMLIGLFGMAAVLRRRRIV